MDYDARSGLLFVGDINSHIYYIDVKKAHLKKVMRRIEVPKKE